MMDMGSMQVPSPPEPGINALVMDGKRGLRIRVEYPVTLEPYGRERILAIAGEAMGKLNEAAAISDPASPDFEMP